MRSRYDSREPCSLCGLPWPAGEPISKWLGGWVHEGCKAVRAASMAAEGVRTELPDARGTADLKDMLVRTKNKGRNFRSKVM